MLAGREWECRRIDGLLDRVRRGQGGELVLKGEAGIGKTALLDHARERTAGLTVLSARGVEAESDLPFAGLLELLRPVLDHLGRIVDAQAVALRGALALGPAGGADRLVISAATLSLLAVVAERRPLLLILDDVHWLDPPTQEVLASLARPVGSDAIALLAAGREEEMGEFAWQQFDGLNLTGLGLEAATQLLLRTHAGIPDAVLTQLHHATGGNPLALLELPSLLSTNQLRGSEPLPDPLPAGLMVRLALRRRIGQLPLPSRRALLVAAASRTGSSPTIGAALRAAGLGPSDLDPAATGGLIRIDPVHIEFHHPLIRSAAYEQLGPRERRAAHQALAGATVEDDRAWHLAAAAIGPDESVAAALEEAAARARERGGYVVAAHALKRSARLTPRPRERGRRLLAAAAAAHLGNQGSAALPLLEAAVATGPDPLLRAEIDHLRGQVVMRCGRPRAAYEILTEGAGVIRNLDPRRSALMLADAVPACFMAGDLRLALETARQAYALAAPLGGLAEAVALGHLARALILRGRSGEARPLLDRFRLMALEGEQVWGVNGLLGLTAQSWNWIGDFATCRTLVERGIDVARRSHASALLPYSLGVLSELELRTGHWSEARVAAGEGLRLAEAMGLPAMACLLLTTQLRLEAAQGREAACQLTAERAIELGHRWGVEMVHSYVPAALGLLELGTGRPGPAVVHLLACARSASAAGLEEPSALPWQPDLIEALFREGRLDEARTTWRQLDEQANRSRGNWARAVALRCAGMLAEGDDFREHFDRALELHAQAGSPFEEARTQLCLSEALRRRRRSGEAREPLLAALAVFEQLGAEPWAARARALSAQGRRCRGAGRSLELTGQELEVALLVARGATNKETAVQLMVSPKTIESHLGRIYDKLAVRSRTELAILLAPDGSIPSARSLSILHGSGISPM